MADDILSELGLVKKDVDGLSEAFDGLAEAMQNTGKFQDGLAAGLINITKTNKKFGRFWLAFNRGISGTPLWRIQNKFKGMIDVLHVWQIREREMLAQQQEQAKAYAKTEKSLKTIGKLQGAMSKLGSGDVGAAQTRKILQNDTFKLLTAQLGTAGALALMQKNMAQSIKALNKEEKLANKGKAKILMGDLKGGKIKIGNIQLERKEYKKLNGERRGQLAELKSLEEAMEIAGTENDFDTLYETSDKMLKLQKEMKGTGFQFEGGDVSKLPQKEAGLGYLEKMFKGDTFQLAPLELQLSELNAKADEDIRNWGIVDEDTKHLINNTEGQIKELKENTRWGKFVAKWAERKRKFDTVKEKMGNVAEGVGKFMKDKEYRKEKINNAKKAISAKFEKMGGWKGIFGAVGKVLMFVGMAMLWGVAIVALLWGLKKLGIMELLKDWFFTIIDTVIVFFVTVWEFVGAVVEWFVLLYEFFEAIFSKDGDIIDAAKNLLMGTVNVLWKLVSIIWKTAWTLFSGIFIGLWDWFKDTFIGGKATFTSVSWGVAKFIVLVIGGYIAFVILTMIGLPVIMAAFLAVAIAAAIGMAFDWLQHGGIAGGGYTVVGEGGPELVKLPAGSRVHSNRQSQGMIGGNTNNINVTVSGRVGANDTEIRDIAGKIGRQLNMEVNRTTSTGVRGA